MNLSVSPIVLVILSVSPHAFKCPSVNLGMNSEAPGSLECEFQTPSLCIRSESVGVLVLMECEP